MSEMDDYLDSVFTDPVARAAVAMLKSPPHLHPVDGGEAVLCCCDRHQDQP